MCSKHVTNTITEQEYKLYSEGKIRKVYESFEHLLVDNLEYYERIIRSLLILYENTFIIAGKFIDKIPKSSFTIPMTPTHIYYMCLTPLDATREEILVGYPSLEKYEFNDLSGCFKQLCRINAFKINIQYCKDKFGAKSYADGLGLDVTNTGYIESVLGELGKDIAIIDKKQLAIALEHSMQTYSETIQMSQNIMAAIPKDSLCNVKPNKIQLYSKVAEFECKYENGTVIRRALRNFRECFEFDKAIASNLKSVYRFFTECLGDYDNELVKFMNMFVEKNRRKAVAIRISPSQNLISVMNFRRCWANYRLIENTYIISENDKNVLVKTESYIAKPQQIGNRLFKEGYFVVGLAENLESLTNTAMNLDFDSLISQYLEFVENHSMNIEIVKRLFQYNLGKCIALCRKLYS